jgi:cellulose synthase/poly-beta-1,6-N-acetylglucosamine synthase-like glycosyltransferase
MKIIYVIFKQLLGDQDWVFVDDNVYILNSKRNDRSAAFLKFSDVWICFFDHDCVFDQDLMHRIESKLMVYPQHQILAGLYKNPSRPTALQVAHNFICNQWVFKSLEENQQVFLGGFFAIYSSVQLQKINFSNLPKWGAEDHALALLLQTEKYKIQIEKELCVEHQTSTQLYHFIRRAYRQGRHTVQFKMDHQKLNSIKFDFWNRHTKVLQLRYRLIVYLHFLILILAKKFQTLRRTNN